MSVVNTRLIDLEEETSELKKKIKNLQQENKRAELKQLNKTKQLATPAIKMEDVQDLISNEKAIIINQFLNAMEKSEGKLE